jgi:hypothetical protein
MRVAPAAAVLVNFDDIDASAGDISLDAAYTGGVELGMPVVGTITAAAPFDFGSAYIGAGWHGNLDVTVQRRLGGTLQFSQTITLSAEGVPAFFFDFTSIDELDFFRPSRRRPPIPPALARRDCSQTTFDDMDFSAVGPPPPM